MIINKFKIQDINIVKKNQPDLYVFLKSHFKEFDEKQQGKLAGAIIEWVLKSGGTGNIFDENLSEFEEEEF